MNPTFRHLVMTLACCAVAAPQELLKPSRPDPAAIDSDTAQRARQAAAKLRPRKDSAPVKLEWRRSGALQAASGFASPAYAGTRSEAAREFLSQHADLFAGVALNTLTPLKSPRLRDRSYVRFQQRLDGIPIRGAVVTLRVGSDNSVDAIQSSLEPETPVRGQWNYSPQQAIERVLASAPRPVDVPRAEQLYLARNAQLEPVWRVLFRSADPPADWEFLVSAIDGAVVEKQDLRAGDRSLGYAYPRNPVAGGLEQVTLENLASTGYLTSEQTKVFTNFPALKGQVEPGTVVQRATRQNGNFLFATDDVRFSEVQLYYGMESASLRFRALGFEGFDAPLPGVVLWQDYDPEQRRFVGADNAFFSPVAFGDGKGGMFFYLTSRNGDTSLDTDIIYHEYAHAVVNELVGPYQSARFKALNEGIADYFSSSFLNDPVMAEYAAKMFNLRTEYLRRADNGNTWPYNTVGESHADGNIWSGALWDVRNALGPRAADEIAINALAMLSPDAEFFEAASSAVDAAGELFGLGAAAVVAAIMEERGIYTDASRTASEAVMLASAASGKGQISGARAGRLLLGAQQYRVEVPNRATKLMVRLEANADVRFYLRYRVPVTVEEGYLVAEQMSATGTNVQGFLSLDNTPELQSGTYYIAVVNTTTTPVSYTIHAASEGGEPAARPATTLLESGVSASGSVPSGPFLASRQFAIQVPEGTGAVYISLDGDQDVDLYVRIGRYVYINNTGFPEADLVEDSASESEVMKIVPVKGAALPAGMYYLGVYNYSSETARFSIRAKLEPAGAVISSESPADQTGTAVRIARLGQ